MPLTRAEGNMYEWATHTWNTIKGQCYHDCKYCYMKRWGKLPAIHFDEKELQTNLGKGNTIFVGSSNDMFAIEVDNHWIRATLNHCSKFDNIYVFQSKDTFNIFRFRDWLPPKVILGTTIETNRNKLIREHSKAPLPEDRAQYLRTLRHEYKTFITVEPIMDFDLEPFTEMIINAKPSFVNIGADSKNHKLPEPSKDKILVLIKNIQDAGIEIREKVNLKRLV